MIRGFAVAVLVFAAASAGARERGTPHPSDDTEVYTGGDEVAPGEAPKRPALAYWRLRATLHLPAAAGPVRVAMLVPLSDGRQDVLARRTLATGFRFREDGTGANLRAEWNGASEKPAEIAYDVAVRISEIAAHVPAVPLASLRPTPAVAAALAPTPHIQSAAPAVLRRARAVVGRAT